MTTTVPATAGGSVRAARSVKVTVSALTALAVLIAAACGVTPQDRPDPMGPPATSPAPTPTVTKRSGTSRSVTSSTTPPVPPSQESRQVRPTEPPEGWG